MIIEQILQSLESENTQHHKAQKGPNHKTMIKTKQKTYLSKTLEWCCWLDVKVCLYGDFSGLITREKEGLSFISVKTLSHLSEVYQVLLFYSQHPFLYMFFKLRFGSSVKPRQLNYLFMVYRKSALEEQSLLRPVILHIWGGMGGGGGGGHRNPPCTRRQRCWGDPGLCAEVSPEGRGEG